eukprot:483472_1
MIGPLHKPLRIRFIIAHCDVSLVLAGWSMTYLISHEEQTVAENFNQIKKLCWLEFAKKKTSPKASSGGGGGGQYKSLFKKYEMILFHHVHHPLMFLPPIQVK